MGWLDLVWILRGSVKGLLPCSCRTVPEGKVYRMEFWSLNEPQEVVLQEVVAVVSNDPQESPCITLWLPEAADARWPQAE